tara:strand:- start:4171 stop:4758 length:588 start_codon:yes stop_codon:yes gene_type:complete
LKILALSPHPDDIEMGAGGFLLSAINKNIDVHVVYCLYEKMFDVETNLRKINYKASWLCEEENRRPEYNGKTVDLLDSILYAQDYTHLLIPHIGDSHQDHKNINLIAQASIRKYKGMTLQYEVAPYVNRNKSFNPNIFFGIDGLLAQKTEWVSSYQDVTQDMIESVISLNKLRGQETTNHHAEAFELLKWSNLSI